MKMTTNRLFRIYALVDAVVIVFSLLQGGFWLINTQVAFAGSFLITFCSFVSYKKMVNSRVEAGAIPDEKDILKKIEDPYELYDDEEEEVKPEAEVKKIPKIGFMESLKNLRKSYQSALSPYRIGAYGVLFVALLFLIRRDYFDAIPFFVGLSVVPLSSFLGIFALNFSKK